MGDGVAALLRKARQIIADGGDPDPCRLGAYCLRCCLAIAQTDLQEQWGDGAGLAGLVLPPGTHPSDARLEDAVRAVRRWGADEIHTRELALAVLDAAIRWEQ